MSRRELRYRRESVSPQAMLGGENLAAEGAVLGADADGEDGGVQEAEHERGAPQAEDKGQHKNLGDDDEIIGMVGKPIGAAADQRRVGKDDDPRRPALAERGEYP